MTWQPVVEQVTDAGAIAAAGVFGFGLGIGLVVAAVVVRWLVRMTKDDDG